MKMLKKTIPLLIFVSLSFYSFSVRAIDDSKYYFQRSVYSEVYKELPKILSQEDVIRYHKVYTLQRSKRFTEAEKIINTIDNPILIGYMYYIKYNLSGYNPSYVELKNWLDEYSDLGVASIIYKIAEAKAKTRSQKIALKQPNSFYDRFIPLYKRHEIFKDIKPIISNIPSETIKLSDNKTTQSLKKYLKSGKTLNVKNILLSPTTIKNLDKNTYDHYSNILAKSYFLDGDDNQAIFWARRATRRKPIVFSEGIFTMGLAYYRLKEYEKSAEAFKQLMKPDSGLSSETIAKGSYWYARMSLILGNTKEYYKGLRLASKYIYNFYGIIASEELGIIPNYKWTYLSFPKDSISVLKNNKYSQRALALLQFGVLDWAEQELIFLANYDASNMTKEDEIKILNALVYMAQQVPMPALGLKFAGQLGMYYGLSHLSYPIFFVELENGYELDPALLLAVMRRESSFYSGAVSGPGATGLMQIMPRTADYVVKKYELNNTFNTNLTSPKANIEIGQQYVKQLIQVTDGNLIYILAGFNGGSYNVDKWKKDSHRRINDPLFFIESIPYRETRNYVKSVTTDYWIYQYKLGLENYALYSLVQGGQPIYYHLDDKIIATLKNFSYKPK